MGNNATAEAVGYGITAYTGATAGWVGALTKLAGTAVPYGTPITIALGAANGALGGASREATWEDIASNAAIGSAASVLAGVVGSAVPAGALVVGAVPVGSLVVGAIAAMAFTAAATYAYDNRDKIADFGETVAQTLAAGMEATADRLAALGNQAYESIGEAARSFGDHLSDALGAMGEVAQEFYDFYFGEEGVFSPNGPIFGDGGLVDQISDYVESLGDEIASWFEPDGIFYSAPIDPLVLDLSGDGITITDISDSNAYFDLDQDGFAEQTAWISSSDGFLAHDANGNGSIDDITELFGDANQSGFEVLAEHDTNDDGVINASDAIYDELLVWQDLNRNGVTDEGELTTLTERGITEIRLEAEAVDKSVGESRITEEGTFVQNGETKTVADVWFENSQVNTISVNEDDGNYSSDIMKLPNLKGYGNIVSLHAAMSADEALHMRVSSLISNAKDYNYVDLVEEIEGILLDWAGVNPSNVRDWGENVDAHNIAFLEAIHGEDYTQTDGEAPDFRTGNMLGNYYDKIINSLSLKFIAQIQTSYLLTETGISGSDTAAVPEFTYFYYSPSGDSITGTVDTVVEQVLSSVSVMDDAGQISQKFIDLGLIANSLSSEFGSSVVSRVVELLESNGTSQNYVSLFEHIASNGTTLSAVIDGSDLADTLNGARNDDILIGGHGDDVMNGAGGNDTYIYSRGDGDDVITENSWNGSGDKLQFTDINASDVSLVRDGTSVTLVIAESSAGAGDGSSIVLSYSLDGKWDSGIESIVFADGTVWNRGDLQTMVIAHSQTDGDDTIEGFRGSDMITGGLGDDVMNGAGGNDTYIYSRGDGDDVITENSWNGSGDKLQFTDINASDVSLVRDGTSVTLVIAESSAGAGDGSSIVLSYSLDGKWDSGIESIVFADGTVWNRGDLQTMVIAHSQTDGDDTIEGFRGSDMITGGLGDDVMNGAGGNDTYVYSRGDGDDVITENNWNGSGDKLQFTDINASDVSLTRDGKDLIIVIAESTAGAGDSGSIFLRNSLDGKWGSGVESIEFANGTVWTKADFIQNLADNLDGEELPFVTVRGTDGADTLDGSSNADGFLGGAGNDTINGGRGSDTYHYGLGDGSDFVDDQHSSTTDVDRFEFQDLNASDVELSHSGHDLIIKVLSDGSRITFDDQFYSSTAYYGIEQLAFADGTVWDRTEIQTYADENFV
ncbi:calcium-binding protein [Grimontia sp. SpTr1]|uniref:calcium-binding protein n=1 Tax=Grimontia sp. SpTr1 TaxID=2995319 RepID=UPI00248C81D6|nr:calcium-binding protein [Grimontia sp. SpTr1]